MKLTTFRFRNALSTGSILLILAIISTSCASKIQAEEIASNTWQWAELVETLPASQSLVPDPENYTFMLNPDGTHAIKADCNNVSGSYLLEGNSLTIELGPSQLAFCGEESLDQLYLELLEKVESYALDNGDLVLSLEDDSGTMTFRAR